MESPPLGLVAPDSYYRPVSRIREADINLVRERADEAARWRAASVTFGLVAALLVLGGTTGGVWLMTAVAVLTLREFYQMVRRIGLD